MKSKLLFLDTETTGLDPNKNGVIQVAMIHGNHELEFKVNPLPLGVKVDKEASKINGYKKKHIKKLPNHKAMFEKMKGYLDIYLNPFDKEDKFTVVGYNVKFDVEFLHGWAEKEEFKFMGSYLDWRVIDVLVLARTAHYLGQMPSEPENFKLETICKVYGITINAHDALDDIKATKELFEIITREWK